MEVVVKTLQDVGRVILENRKSVGLLQKEAAQLIGVSPPVLNKIEQGREIWLSNALKIFHALGIEVVLRYRERP